MLIYKVESRGKVATHRLQSAFIIVFQSRESGVTLGTAVRGVNLKDQSLISDPHGASKKRPPTENWVVCIKPFYADALNSPLIFNTIYSLTIDLGS